MSSQQPVIYSDSMFESEINPPASDVAPKLETIDELSCHLPNQPGKTPGSLMGNDTCSPILMHTDVMDSVFSTTLDHNDELVSNTPMFDDLDFVMDGSKVNMKDDWVSLFKDESFQPDDAVAVKDEELADLFADEVDALPPPPPSRPPTSGKQLETPLTPLLKTPAMSTSELSLPVVEKSNVSAKRSSSFARVDGYGCVSYAKRQRVEPLKPVGADSDDPVAMKRARNTEAARRSRARKMERMTQLEDKVNQLIEEKDGLSLEVDRLKSILRYHDISF